MGALRKGTAELVAFFFFPLSSRLGVDSSPWFPCPCVLGGVVGFTQGLVERLVLLTAWEEEMTNGVLNTSHPIS